MNRMKRKNVFDFRETHRSRFQSTGLISRFASWAEGNARCAIRSMPTGRRRTRRLESTGIGIQIHL